MDGPQIQSSDQHYSRNQTVLPFPQDFTSADKDTVEFPVLGLGAHAAQLLLVAAQAPGVVADLLGAQTAVAV